VAICQCTILYNKKSPANFSRTSGTYEKFARRSRIQERQALKDSKLTSLQLPGRRQPEGAETDAIRVVVDAETPRIEEADDDAVAVRAEIDTTDINIFEQPFPSSEEMANDGVNHRLSLQRFLIFREEHLLIVPRFVRRVGDWLFTNQSPTDLAFVFRELLVVIPGILVAVEDRLIDLATDIENRKLEDRNENVSIRALCEDFFAPRNFGQVGNLFFRGFDPEEFDRFLDTEKVPAHDPASFFLRRGQLESTVDGKSRQILDELIVGVDAICDRTGVITERNPEALLGSIFRPCRNV